MCQCSGLKLATLISNPSFILCKRSLKKKNPPVPQFPSLSSAHINMVKTIKDCNKHSKNLYSKNYNTEERNRIYKQVEAHTVFMERKN